MKQKKPIECRIDLNDGNDSTISTTPHMFQWEKTFPAPEFHTRTTSKSDVTDSGGSRRCMRNRPMDRKARDGSRFQNQYLNSVFL